MDKLNLIIARLDEEILKLCTTQTPAVGVANMPGDLIILEQPADNNVQLEEQENNGFEDEHKQEAKDANDSHSVTPTDTEQTSDSRLNVDEGEEEVNSDRVHDEDVSSENQSEILEEEKENYKGKEEANKEWVVVG